MKVEHQCKKYIEAVLEAEEEMKRCPYCAEEIQDAAIKCRFCNESLPAQPVSDPPKKDPSDPLGLKKHKQIAEQAAAAKPAATSSASSKLIWLIPIGLWIAFRIIGATGSNKSAPASIQVPFKFSPDGCEYSVEFSQKPEIIDSAIPVLGATVNGKRALWHVDWDVYRAECYAVPEKILSSIGKEEAQDQLRKVAFAAGIEDFQISYAKSSLGRLAQLGGVKKQSDGSGKPMAMFVHARNYYGERSMMSLLVVSPSKVLPTSVYGNFLESVKRK